MRLFEVIGDMCQSMSPEKRQETASICENQLPSQALGGYSAGLMRCSLPKEWHHDWGRGWRSKGKSEVST